ncbi:unnamed protein product [Paramecium sonneborni]|uniref:LITAF domain-containing protein n=1 Tax=Paramecium sonneborni TaxID=65129 RepID=A0A8S1PWQ4_9CILI|nr:unnamed protein product [Paramecium sonneborni]
MDKSSIISRNNSLEQINISLQSRPKRFFQSKTSISILNEQNCFTRTLPLNNNANEEQQELSLQASPTNNQFNLPENADNQIIPTQIFCKKCNKICLTLVEKHFDIFALGITIVTLILCWPFICYICQSLECKNILHYCPYCHEQVGLRPYKILC